MQTEKHQCAKRKRIGEPPGYFYFHLCRKPGLYEEDGSWWCPSHAPSKVRARIQKQIDEADLEWEGIFRELDKKMSRGTDAPPKTL